MSLSLLFASVLFVASFATSMLSAVSGMGGGIVLLSIMTFFFPPQIIVPIHGMAQLISNSSRTWYLRNHVHREFFTWFLFGLPIGTVIAVLILQAFQAKTLVTTLLLLIILYTVFRPKHLPEIRIPPWGFFVVGFFVGIFGPLIGSTGPMIAPFFLRADLTKKQIVASKAAVQFIGHLIKIPTFLYLGFLYEQYILVMLAMGVGVLMGTHYGVKLLGKIPEEAFRTLFRVVLLGAAIRLAYQLILPNT